MKELTIDETKRIQTEVLSAVDSFCRDNNIKYSLSCGTLLGAVRHKGYIPWDDDIDICLYRDEYNRFINTFPETYKGVYKLKSIERECTYDRPYAIAYDDSTILIEGKDIWGVKIDIFPIDDVPDDEDERIRYDRKRRRLQKFYLYTSINEGKTWFKTLFFKGLRFLTLLYSRRRIAEKLDSLSQLHNGKGYSRCYENSAGYGVNERPYKKSIFNDLVLYQFEDKNFLGFSDADSYLRATYGDYMILPPIEERVTHHNYKAYKK